LILIFHFKFHRKFIDLAEKPDTVKNERFWDFLLFVTQGIITVLIVPIAGVLLAYAFLMIPVKSVSGVMFTSETGFLSCCVCTQPRCMGRKMGYDPNIAKMYGL